MHKYNPLHGVPELSYYLVETTQFGDFEVEEKERILFYSGDRQELVDLCIKNNWACPENKNFDSWYTHHVLYKGLG